MGYILPITQYTYVNYHQRMIESKKSPYHIGELYKVTFNKVQEDDYNPYSQRQKVEEMKEEVRRGEQANVKIESKEHRYYVDKETNALLTGKGQHMNLQV